MDGFSVHLRRPNRSSGRHTERDGKAIDVETFRWELTTPQPENDLHLSWFLFNIGFYTKTTTSCSAYTAHSPKRALGISPKKRLGHLISASMQVLQEGRDICIYLSKMVWFHVAFISKFAQKKHPHNMNICKFLEHLQMFKTSPFVWTQRSSIGSQAVFLMKILKCPPGKHRRYPEISRLRKKLLLYGMS